MRRRISFFAVLAAAVLMLVPETYAQGRGQQGGRSRGGQQRGGFGGQRGGFGGGFGGRSAMSKMALVGMSQVQDEVEMTDAQKTEVRAALTAYRDEQRKAFEGLGIDFRAMREMSEEERKAATEKMTKARSKVEQSSWTVLALTLEDEQVERIEQIELQMAGIAGLIKDSTVKELTLSKDQVNKIQKAIDGLAADRDKMRQEIMAQFGFGSRNRTGGGDRPQRPEGGERPEGGRRPGGEGNAERGNRGPGGGGRPGGGPGGGGRGGFDREALMKKGEEIQAKALKSAMAVLTDAQKKQYEELKGEKFELKFDRGGRDRGGRGQGGRDRGGRGQGGGSGRPQRPGADDDA